MKAARLLKPFCILAIIGNGAFMIFVLKAWISGNIASGGYYFLILLFLVIADLASILYSVMLLITQRRYYKGHSLITRTQKTILLATLIIQLLFTIIISITLFSGIYDMVKSFRRYTRDILWFFLTSGVILLLVLIIFSNIIIAIHGTKFIRSIRKSFVDDIMDTFDS